MKYRKKPIVVEAFQFTDDAYMVAPKWFTQAAIDEKVTFDRSLIDGHIYIYGCTINRPNGRLFAKLGDYIIRGINGELQPCKSDVFHKAYESRLEGGRSNISQLWVK